MTPFESAQFENTQFESAQLGNTPPSKPSSNHKEGLLKLIEQLRAQDPLFEYNVPPSILTILSRTDLITLLDDNKLLGHLDQVYSQPTITIADPTQIEKYARIGDRVFKRGDYPGPNGLNTGDIFVFKDYTLLVNPTVEVRPKHREKFTVPSDALEIIAYKFFGYTDFGPAKYSGEIRRALNAYTPMGKVKVRYLGAPIHDPEHFVLDGAEGVIARTTRGNKGEALYGILWIRNNKARQPLNSEVKDVNGRISYSTLEPDAQHRASDVTLVLPNPVDYKALRAACIPTR